MCAVCPAHLNFLGSIIVFIISKQILPLLFLSISGFLGYIDCFRLLHFAYFSEFITDVSALRLYELKYAKCDYDILRSLYD
jgi:hypothetical protein